MDNARDARLSEEGSANCDFVTVTIADTGEAFRCRTQESLLESMRRLGKRGIPIGCRSGGCSVCKIEILSGAWRQCRPMSREYVSDEDMASGRVLACCIAPVESVTLRVIGKMRNSFGPQSAMKSEKN